MADLSFRNVALHWYQHLSEIGYITHTIVAAADSATFNLFQELNANRTAERGGLVYRVEHIGDPDCPVQKFGNRNQPCRRRIFASRWVVRLESTLKQRARSVDGGRQSSSTACCTCPRWNCRIPTSIKPSRGTSHRTRNTFQGVSRIGTLQSAAACQWLRASPSVIALVQELVRQCHCEVQDCSCQCDDQVALNELQLQRIRWDIPLFVPQSVSEYSWESRTGEMQRDRGAASGCGTVRFPRM